jgi:hypothetical protein
LCGGGRPPQCPARSATGALWSSDCSGRG